MSIRIAIVGAGPAGTALARILSQNPVHSSLDISIFEGETTLEVRSQGGTLDLRTMTGLATIKAANLFDEFSKYARYDGESLVVCDKNLLKYISMTGDANNKDGRAPEIDRYQLRQLLINSLPEGSITWGKRLKEVKEDAATKTFTLNFRDGSSASGFDLVVGADGAWSKVRPLVTDVQPYYTRFSGHSFTISEPEKKIPEVNKLVNRGSVFSMSDGKWVGYQQLGTGQISGSLYYVREDEQWMDKLGYDVNDVKVLQKHASEIYSDWHPVLRAGLEHAEPESIMTRNFYMLPTGHQWEHRRGVTLLGDAAHVFTPFAGEGANQALADAKSLAESIIGALSSTGKAAEATVTKDEKLIALDKAVAAFEQEMYARVLPAAQQTERNMNLYMDGSMPRRGIERFILGAVQDELPYSTITYPLVAAVVYTYYFFFRLWYKPKA